MDNRPALADTPRTDIVMRLRIQLLSFGVTLACLWTDGRTDRQTDSQPAREILMPAVVFSCNTSLVRNCIMWHSQAHTIEERIRHRMQLWVAGHSLPKTPFCFFALVVHVESRAGDGFCRMTCRKALVFFPLMS